MTEKELSRLYHLNREIERLKSQYDEMQACINGITTRITGLPRGVSDKTALLAELADLGNIIDAKTKESVAEYNRLNRYILSIRDPEMNTILALRFVNCLSWQMIAMEMGIEGDGSTQRKKLYKFLE